MKELIVICIAVLLCASVTTAEEKKVESTDHGMFSPADMKWQDAPPVIPPGAKMAVLKGNPGQEGIFVIRFLFPAGYKIMPHWHPAYENVTVISGEAHIGMGDTFDKSKGHALTAGSFAYMAPTTHHYAWIETETVIQLHGMGPWQLYYVNPDDDPRKKAAEK